MQQIKNEAAKEIDNPSTDDLHERKKVLQKQRATLEQEIVRLVGNVGLKNNPSAESEESLNKVYMSAIDNVKAAQDTIDRLKIEYRDAVNTLQSELKGKEAKAEEMMDAFKNFRRKIAMKAVYSKSGKLLSSKDIDRMESTDAEKRQQVEKARLITIKTNLQAKKIERKLLSKEKLAQGLDIIGFEQFQLENKKLRRRRDEREKELQQFFKKRDFLLSSIEQAEKKLSQMVEESERKERYIKESELSISKKKREFLMYKKRCKKADNLEDGNALSGQLNKQLIKDYEQSKIEEAKGLQYLATLKKRHFELTHSMEEEQGDMARSLQDFIPIVDERNQPAGLNTINL